MLKEPNCFIIGAPKCGTTSLAAYLSEHPNIFVCDPKEPNYWSEEIYKDSVRNSIKTRVQYDQLFQRARAGESVIVDASTTYSWSKNAIYSIEKNYTKPKYIFMLRNPVDLSYSLHQEQVNSCLELEEDFERAWDLQTLRAAGENIPPPARKNPLNLQYRYISSLGQHLQRLFSLVPKERVFTVIFEDLKNNPEKIHTDILEFLNLRKVKLDNYMVHNSRKKSVFPALSRSLMYPPVADENVLKLKKIAIRLGLKGLRTFFIKSLEKKQTRKKLDTYFKACLVEEFAPEVLILENLLGKDLSHWKQ